MINLNTPRSIVYCKIIHNYLEGEIFGDPEIDIGDMIEDYMPKYLFREQYQKCLEVFKDLYAWTSDEFWHELTAFHEVALYYFLMEMQNLKNDMKEDFKKVFYDKELIDTIQKYVEIDKKEMDDDDFPIDILEGYYYNPSYICEDIYDDIDFIELPYLYNEQKANMPIIAKTMGINLDYYFEILPIDIQKQFKSNHITLTGEISELFSYLQQRINSGSLAELFWENKQPVTEKKIHVIIENIMDAYFIGKEVDISREVLVKNGQVDFKLFRRNKKDEKILIEVKKASSSYLKAGYENQLCDYIRYSGCKNAFYLIICFTDKEYKTANDFIHNHIYTDNFQMYINIAILDARKKASPSKAKKDNQKITL